MSDTLPSQEVDHNPVCPHCQSEITEIHWRKLQSFSFFEYIYLCPSCRAAIGISSAK